MPIPGGDFLYSDAHYRARVGKRSPADVEISYTVAKPYRRDTLPASHSGAGAAVVPVEAISVTTCETFTLSLDALNTGYAPTAIHTVQFADTGYVPGIGCKISHVSGLRGSQVQGLVDPRNACGSSRHLLHPALAVETSITEITR